MSQPNRSSGDASGTPDDRVIVLPDGRRFGLRSYGAPQGRPVIALHGTPGSRLKFSAAASPGLQLGLRVIALDRWGYGSTDPHPAPSLSAFARDVGHVADSLRINRFDVMGVSGGGPFAAAAAAVMPERVRSLALFAPVGPIAGLSHPETTGFHRFCFGPLAGNRLAVRLIFRGFRRLMLLAPRIGMATAMSRIPASDRAVLAAPGVASRLAETFVVGLKAGATGPATDMELFGRAWDVDLGRAATRSRVWIGLEDRNVPIPAARYLAGELPGCELTQLPDAGHLWAALNYDKILAWIAGSP